MAVGDRPVRSVARRDMVLSGKRRDAAGRSPTATGGRDKFTTGGVAARLWCKAPRREPLLPGGEFLSGETGQYQGPLVLYQGPLIPTHGTCFETRQAAFLGMRSLLETKRIYLVLRACEPFDRPFETRQVGAPQGKVSL